MSFEPLIYAMIFVGVLLSVEGLYLLIFGKSVRLDSKVNRRLDLLEKGEDPEDVLETLRAERDQHRRNTGIPVMAPLYERAAQANIAFTPTGIMIVIGVMAVMVFVALTMFSSAALILRIGLSALMGYSAVYLWLNNKAKKRMELFEEQLPDAVELIVRSLRVGHPFSSSIAIVAQEMPDPLGTEFGIIADEATYGMDINESLQRMSERINVQDLRFLAVAVSIQSQSGGNLAEVLAGLAAVIRSRFKLFRRVKAITAEARWSGWFLSMFPVMAIIIIQLVEPDYYDDVANTSMFTPAMIAVGVFLVANVLYMRAMVNIKV
ncbi:type II secretion system F family protein [Pontivivens ytuae]|uniref:Type II secretion system F family protein n=1 Tax=Pontivivens ytuae TaxID=2789856 RepID=A0A7S9LTZ5_9RHOB|nr:type II secretion system F family protein [Pontivivens ytuae]QPH55292.1 type II secretion system F family protein [Pontivivens ytuae]